MTTETTDKTETKPVKQTLPPYIALIFLPGKIKRSNDPGLSPDLTGINTRELMRMGQHFGVLPDDINELKETEAVTIKSFFIHPGTNIGIHKMGVDDVETITRLDTKLWLKVCENRINRSYLHYSDPFFKVDPPVDFEEMINFRHEAIEIITPSKPDNFGEPGYRNFSDVDALKLVAGTMHEKWIDRYLVGEKRANVLTFAEKQKAKVIEAKKKLANVG